MSAGLRKRASAGSVSARRHLRVLASAAVWATLLALVPASASAAFGISEFDGSLAEADGSPAVQAGGHPYEITTHVRFNTVGAAGEELPDESPKDLIIRLPAGLVGNPTAVPRCSEQDMSGFGAETHCPANTQIGVVALEVNFLGSVEEQEYALYNMEVPPGTPSSFAFNALGVVVHMYSHLRSESDYGLDLTLPNVNQTVPVIGATTTIWGVPADPRHDPERCALPDPVSGCPEPVPAEIAPRAFLTNATSCSDGAAVTSLRADSWTRPGLFVEAGYLAHDGSTPPVPVLTSGCDRVPFTPQISLAPTNDRAEAPAGVNVEWEIPAGPLEDPSGISQAAVKRIVLDLPQEMSLNPSAAEGLAVCTRVGYEAETATSAPGSGCPNGSKLGTVSIETPLLKEAVPGTIYLAKPYENPFGSLLAAYVVAKDPERGVSIKLAGEIAADPASGRLTARFDDLPQMPISRFRLSFREGQRSPLLSPRTCGPHTAEAEFVPWSASDPAHPRPSEVAHRSSAFTTDKTAAGEPCEAGAAPPFEPTVVAGTLDNEAGSYSPLVVQISRRDGEPEVSSFSARLPAGVSARLAGVETCTESEIATAAAKSGAAEMREPSCPAASEVGTARVGIGAGAGLSYVHGRVYLAGPYEDAPLSLAVIVAARVGAFDLGTQTIRAGVEVDRRTARMRLELGAGGSIPELVRGIRPHVRDLRILLDRPGFTVNPTSCAPLSLAASLEARGGAVSSASTRFQAAHCLTLGFRPRLRISLAGPTHRSANPELRATLTARPGDANLRRLGVLLPRTEMLDLSHVRNVCSRPRFRSDRCPASARIGRLEAWSPLLDRPLAGPVFLREGSHRLPDVAASLDGRIRLDLDGRVDAVGGRIRIGLAALPDLPLRKLRLVLEGGRKGLLVNNTELCRARPRARADFTGQNGKRSVSNPPVKVGCGNSPRKR